MVAVRHKGLFTRLVVDVLSSKVKTGFRTCNGAMLCKDTASMLVYQSRLFKPISVFTDTPLCAVLALQTLPPKY